MAAAKAPVQAELNILSRTATGNISIFPPVLLDGCLMFPGQPSQALANIRELLRPGITGGVVYADEFVSGTFN